ADARRCRPAAHRHHPRPGQRARRGHRAVRPSRRRARPGSRPGPAARHRPRADPDPVRLLPARSGHHRAAADLAARRTAHPVTPLPSRRAGAALDTTLRLLAQEISQPQPGAAAILNRIVDILLVQLLRAWLDTGPADARTPSWLSALTDPVAGPALAALHTQP